MPRRPHHWLPDLIAGRGVVHPGGAACTLNYGKAHPFGLLAQISVRFRGLLSLEKQREIGSQSDSHLWNRPVLGPQLTLEQERSARSSAGIVTHEGHNTFWTITYWFGREIAPSEVSVTFSWPEQGLEVLFSVSGEDLRYAINQATELWIPDPHGYFSA